MADIHTQPLWCQYHPTPGALGFGDNPTYDLATPASFIPELDISWANFNTSDDSTNFPLATEGPIPENTLACVVQGYPKHLYEPGAENNPGELVLPAKTITRSGPGLENLPDYFSIENFQVKPSPPPSPFFFSYQSTNFTKPSFPLLPLLTSTVSIFQQVVPGDILHCVDDPANIRSPAFSSDICIITTPIPTFPKASLINANLSDNIAMAEGCTNGCGMNGIIRMMTGTEEPVFRCPWCEFEGSRLEVLAHLDLCEAAKAENWARSTFQRANNLPALMSSGCGLLIFPFFSPS